VWDVISGNQGVAAGVTAVLTAGLGYLAVWLRARSKKAAEAASAQQRENHSLEGCVSLGQELMPILVESRIRLRADRIVMYQFHNGTVFLTADPTWRMTPTYHNADAGIAAPSSNPDTAAVMLDILQPMTEAKDAAYTAGGVSAVACCRNCAEVCDNRTVYVFDIDNMASGGWKTRMNIEGMHWTVCTQMRNSEGRLAGILALEYRTEPDEQELEKHIQVFCETANSIAAIIAKRAVNNE